MYLLCIYSALLKIVLGENVQLGMIGLGRMGGNIVRRLMQHGHSSVVYDVNPDNVAQLEKKAQLPAKVWRTWSSKCPSPGPCGSCCQQVR
jgi:predicted homoserine dehydrogenase-like protein